MSSNNSENFDRVEKAVRNSTIFATIIITAIPLSYLIWFYFVNDYSLSLDSGTWGTFGDFTGGILNPLIALLAFYWLTQSVIIQKKELNDTTKALVDSSKSQKLQVETQEKKRFEDTFFSLLNLHNKVLEQLHERITIREVLQASVIKKIFKSCYKSSAVNSIEKARQKLHDDHGEISGHYFRMLYQLLKVIAVSCHGSGISEEFTVEELVNTPVSNEEKLYSNILRSFLSTEVTMLLAVNCVCTDPNGTFYKYRLLIERYNFLEHMPLDNKIAEEAINYYDVKAFGKSSFLVALYKARTT
ncbi:putative phage abortive infection protein [Shewanella goraebulensis]|uniref:putative phage abortive infection protein n=1 Tax=Shewanella goraebulensis TaxID=3050637 RepID=UPI0025509779|nr:putative phage abortive infection protein [Shewanella goraebulensis]